MLDLELLLLLLKGFLYGHRRPELDSIESKGLGPRVSLILDNLQNVYIYIYRTQYFLYLST